jgi:hypothetical protein
VTLWSIPSAGVRIKAFSVVDDDIWSTPFVRGISLLDRIHIQEFDQDVGGITGDFLHNAASHKDGDTWWHVHLLCSEHMPEGLLPGFIRPGEGRPVTLAHILTAIGNAPLGVHTRFVQKLSLTYYTHNYPGDRPILFCV